MKRIFSLLIAMVFCIAVFSACQSASASARSPGNQPDVQSVSAVSAATEIPVRQVFTVTENPVRQVFTVSQNYQIKITALQADVKKDAGIYTKYNSVRLAKSIKTQPSNYLMNELPPDRFNGFGADCAARAKI